jgi:hypothetical protein
MTIPGGYVLKPRCIANSEIATAPPHYREIWDLIIREANHADARYRGHFILRGQLFRTYEQLVESLHWYVGNRKEMYEPHLIKNGMAYLRKKGMITTKKKPGGVIITICNYDYYQTPQNYEKTNENTIEKTKERTFENSYEEPRENQEKTIYNKKEKKNNNLIKKEYMSELKDSDITDYSLKIAFEFWKLFKKNLSEFNRNSQSLNNAKCEDWVGPVKLLMDKDNKTEKDFREVYNFLVNNTFWKDKIYSTSKFRKKNDQGMIYFDFFLLQKSKIEIENKIPEKEDFEPLLRKYFKNTTPYFINLFSEYQLMTYQKNAKIFKGKTLKIEIDNLAEYSENNLVVAVNILRKSIEKRHEIRRL